MFRVMAVGVPRTQAAQIVRFGVFEIDSALKLLALVLDCINDPRLKGCRRRYRIKLFVSNNTVLRDRYIDTFRRGEDPEEVEQRCVSIFEEQNPRSKNGYPA